MTITLQSITYTDEQLEANSRVIAASSLWDLDLDIQWTETVYYLTTEHAQSSYGIPVLVDTAWNVVDPTPGLVKTLRGSRGDCERGGWSPEACAALRHIGTSFAAVTGG